MKLAKEYSNTPDVEKGIKPGQEVEIKVRKGTGHIFSHSSARKCLCGSTNRYNYPRNHHNIHRTVQQVLENPDKGYIGTISTHGHTALENKVKNPE